MNKLGNLPVEFYKKIPNYTFTKILLNNFNTFVIEKNNYILERCPPIYVNETKYINLIMNEKKYGIKLGGSTFKFKTHNGYPYYDVSIYFHFKDYYVKEEMFYYGPNGNKKCNDCNVWNYKLDFQTPEKEHLIHTENYCGQMMLMDYRINIKIKKFYGEFEEFLEKTKKLE